MGKTKIRSLALGGSLNLDLSLSGSAFALILTITTPPFFFPDHTLLPPITLYLASGPRPLPLFFFAWQL